MIAKLLCFLGFHDWLVYKVIFVNEFDGSQWKTTTYKCETCRAIKNKIEQTKEADHERNEYADKNN